MIFESWEGLLRVLIAAAVGYVALIAILRTSGKRTLSKMNAFDFVVTVALGSTLAAVILNKNVPLLEGILTFAALAALQFINSWLAVRFPRFERLLKAEPSLLLYRGSFLRDVMRRMRITEAEVLTALRSEGVSSLEVEAVVMETDGSITVIPESKERESSDALADVVPNPPVEE